MPNPLEKLQTRVSIELLKFSSVMALGLAVIPARSIPGTRNLLPEPFDVMDHIGNVPHSMMLGYLAGACVGMTYNKIQEGSDDETHEAPSVRSVRSKLALGGLTAGLLINGLIETHYGMRLLNWENTADPIDLIYGVTAATMTAAYALDVDQKHIETPDSPPPAKNFSGEPSS